MFCRFGPLKPFGVKANHFEIMKLTTNTARKAAVELSVLFATTPDATIIPFKEEILSLCEAFGKSGQSGGSAPYVATALSHAIKKLCLQEPICPIMGINEEWGEIGSGVFQNNRCSAIFKENDSKAYYLDAIIWKGDTEGESGNDWDTFTGNVEGILSRQFIKSFPFTPKTFYIDVTRQQLPEDWTEEPFIEGKEYYIISEFEKTGIRKWHKDKYRYIIKDSAQLKKVWEYYSDPNPK